MQQTHGAVDAVKIMESFHASMRIVPNSEITPEPYVPTNDFWIQAVVLVALLLEWNMKM